MNAFWIFIKRAAVMLLAAVVGSFVMLGLHSLSGVIWPDVAMERMPQDPDALAAFMEAMPLGAKWAVLVSHWLGTLSGSVVALIGTGRHAIWPGLAIGGWFMIGGIANNWMLPAPVWVEAVDLLGYVPLAYLVSRLLVKNEAETIPQV